MNQHREQPQTLEEEVDTRCPNCFTLYKTADHLMSCRCKERTQCLKEYVAKIQDWMQTYSTHIGIYTAVMAYIWYTAEAGASL